MQSADNFHQEKIKSKQYREKMAQNPQEIRKNEIAWWMEEYGFFGEFYLDGDDSVEGYLTAKKQMLQERTQVEVDGLVNLLGLKRESVILDLPCGYGRHSIELAKRSFTVVGSDLNSNFLKVARERAGACNVRLELRQENMIDINYDQEFDVLINMFYAFGFFETDAENLKVLTNFYNALKPCGKFLFHTDVNISRIFNGKYKHDETRSLKSGGELRIIDLYDEETKRINGAWIIKDKENNVIRKNYSVRVYPEEEFIDFCRQVGFKRFSSYGYWDGTPYSDDTEDLIIIAEK